MQSYDGDFDFWVGNLSFKGIEVQLPLYMQSKTQNMGHIVFYILKEIGLTNQKIRQWDN